ncbi:MAG: hypothetical protein IT186_18905 [Acidobacteria bacterium]|nr:hypothetical protein [Acidobacteriota bacterium]
MKHLFGKVAFKVSQTEYLWEDVFLDAEIRGEWPPIFQRAMESLALIARAEDADELPFTEDEADAAATEFRYARDLVRAEEMEKWLKGWGVEFEDWSLWISASLLKKKWGTDGLDLSVSWDEEELGKAVYTELICSRKLGTFLTDFAGCAAVLASLRDGENPPPQASDEELLAKFPQPLRYSGLRELDPQVLRERMLLVASAEHAFRHLEESALNPAVVAAKVRANQTAWTRITYQLLTLPREDVAREAVLGVKEDGLSLEEVAADAHVEVETGTRCIDDFEKPLRDRLLACQKGDLIGPIPSGGHFVLVSVLDKTLPSPSDPVLLQQARTEILETLVNRERDNRVIWAGLS